MKYLLYTLLIFIFTACSIPANHMQDGKDTVTISSNNNSVKLYVGNSRSYKMSGCLNKSFFYENDKYQIEYIRLDNDCSWTGLADGLYQDFLRKNIKGLDKTSSKQLNNGDIYRFNQGQEYFYFISLYDANSNTFVIDYTGDIVSKLLLQNLSINPKNRLSPRLKKELLENYRFKDFFERKQRDRDVVFP